MTPFTPSIQGGVANANKYLKRLNKYFVQLYLFKRNTSNHFYTLYFSTYRFYKVSYMLCQKIYLHNLRIYVSYVSRMCILRHGQNLIKFVMWAYFVLISRNIFIFFITQYLQFKKNKTQIYDFFFFIGSNDFYQINLTKCICHNLVHELWVKQ